MNCLNDLHFGELRARVYLQAFWTGFEVFLRKHSQLLEEFLCWGEDISGVALKILDLLNNHRGRGYMSGVKWLCTPCNRSTPSHPNVWRLEVQLLQGRNFVVQRAHLVGESRWKGKWLALGKENIVTSFCICLQERYHRQEKMALLS